MAETNDLPTATEGCALEVPGNFQAAPQEPLAEAVPEAETLRPDEEFDFDAHRLRAIDDFQELRPLYQGFALCLHSILRAGLDARDIKAASLEYRAKSIKSFGDKAVERSDADPEQPKYRDPIREITDLAGARVIAFFPSTVTEVDDIIVSEFDVIEKTDKSEVLRESDRFGYQSVHYLVKLKANRFALPEYAPFRDLVGEIQVRTILQHAWAEIEHDIQYKSSEVIPIAIRRRFMDLAGLLEIADREFEAIHVSDLELKADARQSVDAGRLDQVELTPDALRAYADKRLGSDGRMREWSYEWTTRLLQKLGFTNLKQLDDCISGYDDDKVSRAVWGNRQGQLTRLENMVMASMGENFIARHFWNGDEWAQRFRERLAKLAQAGIQVGAYLPS